MILTIIVFILVLGILVLVHEGGHFLVAKLAGVKVEEFAIGFQPRLFSFIRGGTRYSINAIPIGGYVKLYGEDDDVNDPKSFSNAKLWKRFLVIFMGVVGNLVLAWIVISIALGLGSATLIGSPESYGGARVNQKIFIASVENNSVAQSAGLQFGDQVISGNGNNFTDINQFQQFTRDNAGKKVQIVIKRSGQAITKHVTLGTDIQKGALGVVAVEDSQVKYPWWKIPGIAAIETGKVVGTIYTILGGIIKDIFVSGKVSADVAGPVGIYKLTGQAVKLGFIYLLQFVALISINLAIFNILPFPALDGGRLLFLFIEWIRGGKKIPVKVEATVHAIGYLILIALIILITFHDILGRFRS